MPPFFRCGHDGAAMKLLLVEDDLAIGEGLRLGLQGAGCRAQWVRRGADTLEALAAGPFDAVVLDPLGRLGTEARPRPPVLILSARSLTQDKITALHRGADDYLTKPFDFDEQLARLVALHRRARGQQPASLQFGPLAIDPLRRGRADRGPGAGRAAAGHAARGDPALAGAPRAAGVARRARIPHPLGGRAAARATDGARPRARRAAGGVAARRRHPARRTAGSGAASTTSRAWMRHRKRPPARASPNPPTAAGWD